jgi:hypothetical protein
MNQNQKQGLTQLTATICEKIRQKNPALLKLGMNLAVEPRIPT